MKCINRSTNSPANPRPRRLDALLVALWAVALPASTTESCHSVSGSRILGLHLRQADPRWAAAGDETFVAWAPAPGLRRVLTPPDLRRFAARNSLAVSSYQPLCFRAATQQLDAGRIQQAIEAELERHGSKPLAIVVMDHSRFPIAVGQLRMRFTGSAAGRDGVRTLSGVILGEGGRTQPIWARVRILFSELRWVATESLPAGVPIRRTQIEQKQVSTSNIPRPPSTIEQIAGLAPRRSIPAGTAVEPVALTNPTEVHGGERIRVEATAGGTRLMLPMIAESSGRRGDRVVVRNPGSGRRVPAQVAGPGLAIVGERQDRR